MDIARDRDEFRTGAGAPERQVLVLRREPVRREDRQQGLSRTHPLHRRPHGQVFDITGDTALNGHAEPLVELHAPDRLEGGADVRAPHRHRADAEVLLHHGTDLDPRSCALWRAIGGAGVVRVDGDQRHVHEWRFARSIEARSRHHRVVPVEHLALAGRTGCRRGLVVVTAELATEQKARARRDQAGAHQGGDDGRAIHGVPPSIGL